ncbi:UDP-N-acetylmuramate--L-alanine ligase [Schaalia turicensis]|uniref:UDP-N-acetylmuramate--L-alanine ligase n=1 Tax=Schaalia turicensis TaxID=131111 RepID=UPI003F630DC3
MSVVAELLAARGARVTGSDRADSDVLARLNEKGIRAFVGHDATHVDDDATVVVSTAIRESNPELARARELGLDVIHRSQALALAASGMRFVGVAGAHGKTTTSGMIAVGLRAAGLDPSVAVGGIVPQFGSGAHLGTSDVFVAEADESDGSFLNYTPSIEVVTNVEPDHLDRYGTREAFEAIFVDYAKRLVPGGLLVCCAEDAGTARLSESARELGIRVVTYGRPDKSVVDADVTICDVEMTSSSCRARVSYGDISAELSLGVPGVHNILNAVGAWIAGVELGVEPGLMASSLAGFTGTARRFELRGTVGDRRVFDDYAHHPTEVSVAIEQARLVADGADVTVVFQPHLYSRTRLFADRFAKALSGADHVVLADIYAAREDEDPAVTSGLIADQIEGAECVHDMHEAARTGARLAGSRGVLITMGAGSITQCADDVIDEWQRMDAS